MKTALLACMLAVAAVAAPAATSATGRGTMSFGHEDTGRAYLRFDVRSGQHVSGSLTFAAEHHHDRAAGAMFPDVVVTLGTIQNASFGSTSVEFSGPGRLHDDAVTVTVRAYDRAALEVSDRFVIKCTDGGGKTVFQADGTLFRGDIAIRREEGE